MSLAALIIAVAAAAISLVSFAWTAVWSIWQHRQVTQGRLYVRASFALAMYGKQAEHVIDVTATNTGMVPVTLNAVEGEVKGASQRLAIMSWQFQTPGPLPQKLGPGETWSGHTDPDELRRGAAQIAPGQGPWKMKLSVRDAAQKHHSAPAITL